MGETSVTLERSKGEMVGGRVKWESKRETTGGLGGSDPPGPVREGGVQVPSPFLRPYPPGFRPRGGGERQLTPLGLFPTVL